jgi:hypothetical protein
MHGREPGDTNSTVSTNLDTRNEGDRLRPTNQNSPQQHATRRAGNVSADSLESSASKVAGQERQPIRELSPLRPQFSASARGTSRSRKNSQELSPTRNAVNTLSHPVPSAAAVQRALSANKPPPQASVIDGALDSRNSKSGDTTPRWPASPRLTSPPASNARNSIHPNQKQDSDMTAPNSSQKRVAASVPDLSMTAAKPISEKEDNTTPRSGLKTPARGVSGVTPTLETVAENSIPDTPSIIPPSERSTVSSPRDWMEFQKDDSQDAGQTKPEKESGDSESDNGGANPKIESQATSGTATGNKPSTRLAKKASANLATTKSKVPEPPTRSMTVETETSGVTQCCWRSGCVWKIGRQWKHSSEN